VMIKGQPSGERQGASRAAQYVGRFGKHFRT